MKIKNIRRAFSVLLAVALLAATAIPMSLFSVSAEDTTALEDAVKEAWGNLQKKYEIPLFGYRVENSETGSNTTLLEMDEATTSYKLVTQAQLNGEDENFDKAGLPKGITTDEFGSGYFSFVTNSTTSAGDGHDAALFDMYANSTWKYDDGTYKRPIAVSDIADIYVYYKTADAEAPEDTSTVNSRFYIVNSSYSPYGSEAPVFQAPKNSGGWQKLSVEEAAPGFLEGCTIDGDLMRFNVAFGDGFKSTVTMGGAFVLVKVAAPDFADMDAAALLNKYYTTDMSGYVNTEPLKAAVAELEQALGKDQYVTKLKTAWQNLNSTATQMSLKYFQNSTGAQIKDDSKLAVATTDNKNILGNYARKLAIENTSAFGNNGRLIMTTSYDAYQDATDIIFSYKVENLDSKALQHDIKLQIASANGAYIFATGNFYEKDGRIRLTADGAWHTIRLSEILKNTTWDTVRNAIIATGQSINFFIFHDKMTADITYGTPIIVKKDTTSYPGDAAYTKAADWYLAAQEVNADDYYNADLFVEARAQLGAACADEIALDKLQSGWKNLKSKLVETTLYKYVNSTGSSTTTDFAVDAADTDDQKVVGSKTRTISVTQTSAYGNNDRIMFKFDAADVPNLKDMVFSYKINSITDPSKANIKILIQGSHNGITGVSPNAISLDTTEGWHTVKVSDLLSQCMSTSWDTWEEIITKWTAQGNNANGLILIIYHDAMTANITYGTPIVLKDSGTYPSTTASESWTAVDWLLEANKILPDINEYYDTDAFVAGFNALAACYPEVMATEHIKTAYGDLATKGYGELKFAKYKDSNGADATSDENYNISNSTADGMPTGDITAENLGSAWKEVPVKSTSAYSYQGLVVMSGNGGDIDDLADGEIWYKATKADGAADPTVKLKVLSTYFGDYGDLNSETPVTLNTDGDWHSFKISDCLGEGWQTAAKVAWRQHATDKTEDLATAEILSNLFIYSGATDATITYGSFLTSQKVATPADIDSWTLKDAIKATVSVLATDLVDETAIRTAYGKAVDVYKVNNTISEGDCTFNDKVDICDLVRFKANAKGEKVEYFEYAVQNTTFDSLRASLLN